MNKSTQEIMRRLCRGGYMEGLWLCRRALEGSRTTVLMTPNAEMLGLASKDKRLAAILKEGDILFPDGIGVYLAMRRLGMPIAQRSCGIELCQRLLENVTVRKSSIRVFLLGGKEGVAIGAADALSKSFKSVRICGTNSGYFNPSGEENDHLIKKINESRPDLLLVCMGFPRQEKWMLDNRHRLTGVKLMMGLGGSLDAWAGNIPRAPGAVRELGFEWAYRVLKDPIRIKRLPHIAKFAASVAMSSKIS